MIFFIRCIPQVSLVGVALPVLRTQKDTDKANFRCTADKKYFISFILSIFEKPLKMLIYVRKTFTLRKKCYWIKSISFQKHVYHGLKSICYRISKIFVGSCSIFLWNNIIHAYGKKFFWFNSIFFSVQKFFMRF